MTETSAAPVVDLFTRQAWEPESRRRVVRLSPELDGLEMLYSNDANPDRLYSMKILCWGLQANGEVIGLVPWLSGISPCPDIHDPLNGHFEGYYDPGIDEIFWDAPAHKIIELQASAEYYQLDCQSPDDIVQEIPDHLGTHAVLTGDSFQSITLVEVLSWRLHHDGSILGMLIDEDQVQNTPVLPGDEALYASQDDKSFRYFFQHRIANKIKARDPEALAAIALLMDR